MGKNSILPCENFLKPHKKAHSLSCTRFWLIVCYFCDCLLAVHCEQQFFVRLGAEHSVFDKFHRFNRRIVSNVITQNPHAVDCFLAKEQVVATCARCHNVDSREDAFVRQLAVELKFHIACAFKLFENHLIHLGAGFGKSRCDDGERATVLDVTCCSEEAFGLLQSVGIDTTGEDFSRGGSYRIISASKAVKDSERNCNEFGSHQPIYRGVTLFALSHSMNCENSFYCERVTGCQK